MAWQARGRGGRGQANQLFRQQQAPQRAPVQNAQQPPPGQGSNRQQQPIQQQPYRQASQPTPQGNGAYPRQQPRQHAPPQGAFPQAPAGNSADREQQLNQAPPPQNPWQQGPPGNGSYRQQQPSQRLPIQNIINGQQPSPVNDLYLQQQQYQRSALQDIQQPIPGDGSSEQPPAVENAWQPSPNFSPNGIWPLTSAVCWKPMYHIKLGPDPEALENSSDSSNPSSSNQRDQSNLVNHAHASNGINQNSNHPSQLNQFSQGNKQPTENAKPRSPIDWGIKTIFTEAVSIRLNAEHTQYDVWYMPEGTEVEKRAGFGFTVGDVRWIENPEKVPLVRVMVGNDNIIELTFFTWNAKHKEGFWNQVRQLAQLEERGSYEGTKDEKYREGVKHMLWKKEPVKEKDQVEKKVPGYEF
ncbi:MAG: hypothetical protein Q9191_001909 [Dirinaria sp. TL-2023a]